ncbi:SGNH/GDSL hydrolase family protein [Bacillus cereus]|uniref:SGNH/GDSL hydrolase family protein n=1 Tax=Bacillus cereus TaxID=1396 RepID=UPI003980B921
MGLFSHVIIIASVLSGKLYWNKKVAKATQQISEVKETSKKKEDKDQDTQVSFNEAYTNNFPDMIKEKIKKAVADKKAINLVIVGDEASSSEKGAWPAKLVANLDATYGKGIWNVTVKEYKGESTGDLLVNKLDKEIAKENPDVILFQPPFITDNNKVGNGNSVVDTQKFIQALSSGVKDAVVVIQPSNPVYNAKNYPKAVEALEQFAVQNGYTYINHWKAWPNATTKEILPYLKAEFGFLSEKGNEIWAQYVTNYFVGK